jgi:uncharacterized MnhB-related membrane protein
MNTKNIAILAKEGLKMIYLYSILILVMLISAIAAVFFENLINAVVAAGLVSLLAAALFFFLQAPDVAMTEAIIGAGLTTAIFVVALMKTKWGEDE